MSGLPQGSAIFATTATLANTGFVASTAYLIPPNQVYTRVTTAVAGNVSISLPMQPILGVEYTIVNASATQDFIMIYPGNVADAKKGTIDGQACADATATTLPTTFVLSPGECHATFVASALGATSGTGATWFCKSFRPGTEKIANMGAATNNRTFSSLWDYGKTFLIPALTVGTQPLIVPAPGATTIGWKARFQMAGTAGQIARIRNGAANINNVLALAASGNAPVATSTAGSTNVDFTATAIAGDWCDYIIATSTVAYAYAQSCTAAGLDKS